VLVLETLGLRWFAVAFLAALLWAAWPEGGAHRAFRFLAIAALASFAAEFSSTHTGFPYGDYAYVADTRGRELYLANIPAFVPLSFGSVVYAGRALVRGTAIARTHTGLVLGSAAAATMLDLVIDPITLQGDRWFLGSLYAYGSGGPWFDVPLSNFGGWILVSSVIVALDEALARGDRRDAPSLRGRVLAMGICVFFVVLGLWLRDWAAAGAGAGITLLVALLAFAVPRDRPAARSP